MGVLFAAAVDPAPSVDTIPGLAEIPKQLFTQCGIVSVFLFVCLVVLAYYFVRRANAYDALVARQSEMFSNIVASRDKLEQMNFAMQLRGREHDDG